VRRLAADRRKGHPVAPGRDSAIGGIGRTSQKGDDIAQGVDPTQIRHRYRCATSSSSRGACRGSRAVGCTLPAESDTVVDGTASPQSPALATPLGVRGEHEVALTRKSDFGAAGRLFADVRFAWRALDEAWCRVTSRYRVPEGPVRAPEAVAVPLLAQPIRDRTSGVVRGPGCPASSRRGAWRCPALAVARRGTTPSFRGHTTVRRDHCDQHARALVPAVSSLHRSVRYIKASSRQIRDAFNRGSGHPSARGRSGWVRTEGWRDPEDK